MMRLSSQQITQFQEQIFAWFALHKRNLPWRDIPAGTSLEQRAYRVLVSEVMLQQTQVERVMPKYIQWLEKFPTVRDLAKASIRDVVALWSGLGYNRRALYLKRTAEELVKRFPRTEEELMELPGIGKYTARAVLCFAFKSQVAVVDTNVRKVIITQFINKPTTEREIQEIADQLLPVGRASEWNQALMDYASHVLKEKKIPIPKQSKFIGSNRYFRGQILKILSKKYRVKKESLYKNLQEKGLALEKFQKIIEKLHAEGFIVFSGDDVSLKE